MCIIAVSKAGVRQPSMKTLKNCFEHNPDGAGFMYARNGQVIIHKGFMNWEDFSREIKAQHFTAADPVVYHFRISTQAHGNPGMTHPFPLTSELVNCGYMDVACQVGIAHNGIIRMTSNPTETTYSDTALFITQYMTKLIQKRDDITDPTVIAMIKYMTESKWAIMDGESGEITTVGNFINERGLLFSNSTYWDYKLEYLFD